MRAYIFQLYHDIAFNEELKILSTKFLGNSDLIDKGYFYYPDKDEYVNFEMIEDSENAFFSSSIITRNDFISINLEQNRKEVLSYLKELKTETSLEEFKSYLKVNFDELDKAYLRIKRATDFSFEDIITSHIEKLITDLKILFEDVSGHHKLFNHILQINLSTTYFGCKDLKWSFFKELYVSTYEMNLIDDSVIDEHTFITVFTTPKPVPESQIIFMCGNALVAHYLESLEIFFNNLNPNSIEQSGMFLSKQKTPLTSSIIYASKSRASEKAKSKYSNIEYNINLLKEQFLE